MFNSDVEADVIALRLVFFVGVLVSSCPVFDFVKHSRIPVEMLITAKRGAESPKGKILMSALKAGDAHIDRARIESVLLALAILHLSYESLQQSASFSSLPPVLQAYPASLPVNLDTFPACWTDSEFALLKGSSFGRRVSRAKQNLVDSYQTIKDVVAAATKETNPSQQLQLEFQQFRWAMMCVKSRCFGYSGIPLNRETTLHDFLEDLLQKPKKVLAPFANMANHSRDFLLEWDVYMGDMVLRTVKRCNKGQSGFICYGQKSKQSFLEHYGFVPHDGSDKWYPQEVEIDLNERSLKQLVQGVLDGLCTNSVRPLEGDQDPRVDCQPLPVLTLGMGNFDNLLVALRGLVVAHTIFTSDTHKDFPASLAFVSVAIERSVLQLVRDLCTAMVVPPHSVSATKTGENTDQKADNSQAIKPINRQNATTILTREARLLEYFAFFSRWALTVFDADFQYKEHRQRMETLFPGTAKYGYMYLRESILPLMVHTHTKALQTMAAVPMTHLTSSMAASAFAGCCPGTAGKDESSKALTVSATKACRSADIKFDTQLETSLRADPVVGLVLELLGQSPAGVDLAAFLPVPRGGGGSTCSTDSEIRMDIGGLFDDLIDLM